MALSHAEHTKLKLDELENLKRAMGEYQGERLGKLKRAAEMPEKGDPESEAGEDAGEEDAEAVETKACPHCGKEIEAGEQECSHCGKDAGEEGGGAEGGLAGDTDRLAALAKARNDAK